MKISLCVGEYSTIPYFVENLRANVYSIEELCYCIKENAYLLDMTFMDEKLLEWIGVHLKLSDLATELYPIIRKKGSLSSFVAIIQEYVGLYDAEVIAEIEDILKSGSGLSKYEKKKNQIDFLVEAGKYSVALKQYGELLDQWKDEEEKGEIMPPNRVKALILHNKAVVYAYMFDYDNASKTFYEAYLLDGEGSHYEGFLGAKRMELDENAYISFLAEHTEGYESSLRLEKKVEAAAAEFETTSEGERLRALKSAKEGTDRSDYENRLDEIAQLLKDEYRNSVEE